MKHTLVAVVILVVCSAGLVASAAAQGAPKRRPPVIDTHLHALPAKGWPGGPSFVCPGMDFAAYDPRTKWGFRKNDNAFLAVDDVAALQAAADRLSPQIIRKQLDYWTFILGPKFSKRERSQMNLSRFYSMAQIEYCRNFIFKRHFPIHKIFERGCEIGLWRLTANRISEVFG